MSKATRFVALLRGINVSGRNPIRMAALAACCVDLGFGGVQTYLQSGNLVFGAPAGDAPKLAASLQRRIAKEFGHEIEVLVLPDAAFSRVARGTRRPGDLPALPAWLRAHETEQRLVREGARRTHDHKKLADRARAGGDALAAVGRRARSSPARPAARWGSRLHSKESAAPAGR